MDLLWIYLGIVSIGSFLLMGFDKLSAKMGSERIPELWFALCSLAGGIGGIILGMIAFHHKVNKTSFQLKVAAAAIPTILVILFIFEVK